LEDRRGFKTTSHMREPVLGASPEVQQALQLQHLEQHLRRQALQLVVGVVVSLG
jgi:hypothetical protein